MKWITLEQAKVDRIACPWLISRWQSLTLAVKGAHFWVFLNNTLLFEADDPTIKDAGKIGLWTKADSVTYFDDLSVKTLRHANAGTGERPLSHDSKKGDYHVRETAASPHHLVHHRHHSSPLECGDVLGCRESPRYRNH